MTNPFKIGDTVTTRSLRDPSWDGTVVDTIDDTLTRVYWRYPLGRVTDHHAGELIRIT